MAKKDRIGSFQTAAPVGRDDSGVALRDLLEFQAGKEKGSGVTKADIEKIITEKGISQRDARRIRKGADQFLNAGLDYRVTGGGRYNVNSPEGAETRASRKAGNLAGFNAGDLVKLGRNVSTLVGLADMSSADYAKSKEPKPWESTEGDQPIGTARKKFDEEKFSWETGENPPVEKKKGGSGKGGAAPSKFDPGNLSLPKLDLRIGEKPMGFAEYAMAHKDKWGKGSSKEPGTRKTASGFETSIPEKTEAPGWQQFIFGDATSLWDGQAYKDLATAFNPAQLWSKEARDKASTLGHARGVQFEDERFAEEGYIPKRNAKGDLLSVFKPENDRWWAPKEDSATYTMKDGKLLNKKGEKLYMPPTESRMTNLGIFTPTPSKIIGPPKTPQFLKTGAEKVKNVATNVANKAKGLINPSVTAPNLPNPSSMVSMKQAQRAMKEVQEMSIDRAVKENWIKKMSDFIKANKDKLQSVDDAEAASYNLDGFKKGGKLPMGGGGIKFPTNFSTADWLKQPVPDYKFNPYKVNTTANLEIPKYTGTLNAAKQRQQTEAANLNADVESAMGPAANPGRYLTNTPELGGVNPFGKDNVAGDVAGKVAKYALPFIGEGLARKELNKIKPADFKTADFMTGAVHDLPRPNMKLRYREPVGPDVQGEIAGQKFADAQERDAEANYQIQNSMSKLSQMDQILNRTNQGIQFNTQGKNQNSMFNAQQKMQVAGAKAESMKEPFIAAQQHLATDISTGAYLSTAKKSQLAEEILKYEKPGSPRYEMAVRWLGGAKGKKGMKFKV